MFFSPEMPSSGPARFRDPRRRSRLQRTCVNGQGGSCVLSVVSGVLRALWGRRGASGLTGPVCTLRDGFSVRAL